ncbi:MAG: tetratricopeptide repeat protein [Alphaproteobacteria bacterium]|nr:tetratricopeptide repeat protein [Alphaproteobacteria bacterium]
MVKQKKDCENCKKYQEQAFELEVDEDLQQERLNRFWKKYRWLVYALVILILGATAGIQLYQSWRMKVRLAESDIFENAVVQIFAQKPEEAKPALMQLAQNGRTGYKHLARLELAGLAARQNDTETALKEFKTLMDSDAPESLRAIATLSYVGHQVDTADTKTLLQQLQPFLDNPAFVGMAAELAAVLYLRDNKTQDAQNMLKKALALPNLSETVQVRLKALSQIIESK